MNQAPVRQWHRISVNSAHHPRLLELGFLPLENVCVLQRSWFKTGALVVQVGDAVFGLRPDEASQIEVHAHTEMLGSLSAA
ncbi:FeoA family protein [Hydrogenophaga sp. PAMC20947]|uniref:FeoA family protein n=1 Tax=Hydrogenophaga sp. PAMC20947 TaxID=2565558 RepID=UPI001FFA505E|nr:FeoA family protein [Hydrogenophaga sp. PAMC20947]